MSELPPDWVEVPVGDVVSIASGIGFPMRYQGETSGDLGFYKVGDISRAVLEHAGQLRDAQHYVSREVAAELKGKPIPPGATVFAKIGEAIKLNRRAYTISECLIDNNVMAIKALVDESDRYVYMFLRTQDFTELSRATTVPSLRKGDIESLSIPLAPLNEQKRIADKLDAVLARVDACRERLDRIPVILKRFRQSVLAAATSGKLTEEWREEQSTTSEWSDVELGSVARDFSYGSAAKSSQSGDVPVLRMGNIQEGKLDWTDLVYTSNVAEITKYRLTNGDVLFNRTNSPELVGKTAVYRGEREAIYAGYLIKVRCTDGLLPDYLNYCLNSPAGRDYCWRVKSDGVSQSNINAKKLAAFTFRLPPIEEQHEIVRCVESLFAYADRLEARYTATRAHVERLTQALLAKAFRGELVPQDPNDEPASVLLERIRAAREAAPTKPRPRKGDSQPSKTQKAEVTMLNRKDIQDAHLTTILKERGPLTAEALWSASQLDIDDFYDQLKDEEARGLLEEQRGESATAPRLLEATA